MQTDAIWMYRHGGPDVLVPGVLELGEPGPGELRVRQQAVGLNFAEIYQRRGSHGPHATGGLPTVIGTQGAGVVEAVGAGVQGFTLGQPVAYVHERTYARHARVPAHRAIPLPDSLPVDLAAAFLVRGLTAEYLLHRLFPVRRGHVILVHAAAGGMGEVLCQWAHALGAEVIGTVGRESKREVAERHGCRHVIHYRRQDFVAQVNEITGGRGVDVVYDAVGRDVFLPSLDCLKPRGMAINFGTASGDVEAFDLQRLHAKSLSVCRPTLKTYMADPVEMREAAGRFIAALEAGWLKLAVARRYPLAQAARAHAELESGETTGAAILVP